MLWAHAVSSLDGRPSDGIHLVWSPPLPAGYSVRGFDVWRRDSRFERELSCHELTRGELEELDALLTVTVATGTVFLRLATAPDIPEGVPDEPWDERIGKGPGTAFDAAPDSGPAWRRPAVPFGAERVEEFSGVGRDVLRQILAPATLPTRLQQISAQAPDRPALVYDIRLDAPTPIVAVELGVRTGFAVALREGRATDAAVLAPRGGRMGAAFERRWTDQVLVYVPHRAGGLRICVGVAKRDLDPRAWAGTKKIADGLQMPFATVNPAVGTAAQELALATSRLLPGETLGNGDFRRLSRSMNGAGAWAGRTSPVFVSLLSRDDPAEEFIELPPWRYGLALALDAPWRRALGLGLLDEGANLVPGDAYDYLIIGTFRRRDLEERLLGFHAVPLGLALPAAFRLERVLVTTEGPRRVEVWPPPPAGALEHACRKGLWIRGRVTLQFDAPVDRVVLELEPAAGIGLNYLAEATDLILGLPSATFAGGVPADARVELDFPQPVDSLELRGQGFLYGIRLPAVPKGTKPDEEVTLGAVVYGVVYEPTAPPAPPPFLGTLNLQEPPLPLAAGDPPVPPNLMGFHLYWLPPPPAPGFPAGIWPADLATAAPTAAIGYEIERRRVSPDGPFEPFDPDPGFARTLITGSRGRTEQPTQVSYGADLLALFPEEERLDPPVPLLMDVEDVLLSARKPGGPPPGSLHQYRIASVDVIGRRSAAPTTGSVVRLEKRLPPPVPPGPARAADAQRTRPIGVQARVIQAADPHLIATDAALLGGHGNAIVLEWGWTAEERAADPFAREFRVYWQPHPPDLVRGSLVGPAVRDGAVFRIDAAFPRPVAAGAFVGQFVNAGGYPFRILSHPGGAAVALTLEPSALEPARVPAAGPITLRGVGDGSEQRPPAWDGRIAVRPIAAEDSYSLVLHDRVALDAANPAVRVWLGVSAADDQSYIPDGLAAGPNSGRPGNESAIVAAVAAARYAGRPTFTVPPPLPDVPEIVTAEVSGDEVVNRFDLPTVLPGLPVPAGHWLRLERLPFADLAALASARPDDRIGVSLPNGTSDSYVLGNPDDQAAFLAAIRSGEPGRIADKFLMDLLLRHAGPLEPLWQAAGGGAPVSYGAVADVLPNTAGRHAYRVRLVDPRDHVSAGAGVVPFVFRVPSRRVPGPPDFGTAEPVEGSVALKILADEAYDLAGLLVFAHATDAFAPADPALTEKPDLLRVPNRRDLPPQDGIRLRLASGAVVAPSYIDRAQAAADGRRLRFEPSPAVGHDRRVLVWACAVTRDRIPSLLIGPRVTTTGPPAPAVPALAVAVTGGRDRASWAPPPARSSTAVERSADGGATWSRVSPLLPPGVTEFIVEGPAAGARLYRLRVEVRGRGAAGPAVAPA